MRIVSGKYKGRRINPPNNITARPTTDFAKESLFNMLNSRIDFETAHALDLFAGTGSISFELASRGCRSVLCVERARLHADFIRKTCSAMGMGNVTMVQGDVFTFLRSCKTKFDFIFADPPYDLPELEHLPGLIAEYDLLLPDGLFVLEHPKRKTFDTYPHFSEHRSYGNVNFSFFKSKESAQQDN